MNFKNQSQIDTISQRDLVVYTEISIGFDNKDTCTQNNIINADFLSKCTNLKILFIYQTQITELPLKNSNKLTFINLCDCQNLQNLNCLEECRKLKEIHFTQLNITSIMVLKEFKNLKKITILHCIQITNYYILENCISLSYLRLDNTNLQDISPITNLRNLKTLILSRNKQLLQYFDKEILNKQKQVQLFLKNHRKTRFYKDYKHQRVRISLKQAQTNIQQFKNSIKNQIYQNKVNLINTMKLLIKFQ